MREREMLSCDYPDCPQVRHWRGLDEHERAGWFFTAHNDFCPYHGCDLDALHAPPYRTVTA